MNECPWTMQHAITSHCEETFKALWLFFHVSSYHLTLTPHFIHLPFYLSHSVAETQHKKCCKKAADTDAHVWQCQNVFVCWGVVELLLMCISLTTQFTFVLTVIQIDSCPPVLSNGCGSIFVCACVCLCAAADSCVVWKLASSHVTAGIDSSLKCFCHFCGHGSICSICSSLKVEKHTDLP